MSTIYNLEPRFDSRKSFYGKAKVVVEDNGRKILYSYNTPVVKFNVEGVALGKYATCSATTLRHVREFLRQEGYPVYSKSEMRKHYLNENF